MTYNKTIEKAHDGVEAVNDAAKNLYEVALETAHDGVEAMNDAAKNLNELANEQWSNISQEAADNENLIIGVLFGVASILFIYGLCKVVTYFDKQVNGRK